jgi:hypothetical protein
MSFKFDWEALANKELAQQIRARINQAVKADKNSERVGSFYVTEINFGSQSPEITLVDVNELTESKVRTGFVFSYEGDATITFYTRIQLNPLLSSKPCGMRGRQLMGVFQAHHSLIAPIYVSLSNLRLEGKVVVGYEKPYVLISLKNEALKSVQVNSSFDGCSASHAVERVVRNGLANVFSELVKNPLRLRL